MPRTRSPLTAHLRDICRALKAIERSLGRVVSIVRGAEHSAAAKVPKPKRTLNLSRRRRAELKLQGQYMGYVRQLKPRQKAQVKAAREQKGYRAAIAVARKLRSSI